jgi:hypothetical protein
MKKEYEYDYCAVCSEILEEKEEISQSLCNHCSSQNPVD